MGQRFSQEIYDQQRDAYLKSYVNYIKKNYKTEWNELYEKYSLVDISDVIENLYLQTGKFKFYPFDYKCFEKVIAQSNMRKSMRKKNLYFPIETYFYD